MDMKAESGDFIKKDGRVVEVSSVDAPNRQYLMSDGGVISDDDVTHDMILLPSEVL